MKNFNILLKHLRWGRSKLLSQVICRRGSKRVEIQQIDLSSFKIDNNVLTNKWFENIEKVLIFCMMLSNHVLQHFCNYCGFYLSRILSFFTFITYSRPHKHFFSESLWPEDTRRDQKRPEETRPDQTRPDHTRPVMNIKS